MEAYKYLNKRIWEKDPSTPPSSDYSDNFEFQKFLKNADPTLDQIHIFFQIEKIGWRLALSDRDMI